MNFLMMLEGRQCYLQIKSYNIRKRTQKAIKAGCGPGGGGPGSGGPGGASRA